MKICQPQIWVRAAREVGARGGVAAKDPGAASAMRKAGIVALVIVLLWIIPVSLLAVDPLIQDGEASQNVQAGPPAIGLDYRIFELGERDAGDRLRGDFEPPRALLVVFTETWSDSLADLVAIAAGQTHVYLLIDPNTTTASQVRRWLERYNLDARTMDFIWLRFDTAWVRDYGPFEVRQASGERVWIDAAYAATRPDDDAVPSILARKFAMRAKRSLLPLQGGAIISSGNGLCAATSEYLVENHIDVDDVPTMDSVLETLGCRVFVALPALVDERTRHADMFAQFLAPDVVAVAEVHGPDSEYDSARMDVAALALQEAGRRMGQSLRIVRVPLLYFGDGKYRTYLNGLRLATDYVVPSYGDVPDDVEAAAHRLLSEAMPGINVAPVPADAILDRFGSLHCITSGLTPHLLGLVNAGDPLDATSTCDDEDHREDLECHADDP